jgi:nucleotide-binding universal stress UspA family protein
MTDPTPATPLQAEPPKRILLATDLSARCDRAVARASQLAAEWDATLFVLHVLEKEPPPNLPSWQKPQARAKDVAARIAEDFSDTLPVEVIIEAGSPAKAALKKCAELDCGLIVTGIASEESFGTAVLGSTVDRIVRASPAPVLVVKSPVRKPYSDLVVATDFSEPSRFSLESALHNFPEAKVTLFHAYRVPFAEFLDGESTREEFHRLAQGELAEFLEKSGLPPETRARLNCVIEYGAPDTLLGSYIEHHPVDLVVLGTHGRSGLSGLLLGSVAEGLLQLLPLDVLVVRPPLHDAAAARQAASAESPSP